MVSSVQNLSNQSIDFFALKVSKSVAPGDVTSQKTADALPGDVFLRTPEDIPSTGWSRNLGVPKNMAGLFHGKYMETPNRNPVMTS